MQWLRGTRRNERNPSNLHAFLCDLLGRCFERFAQMETFPLRFVFLPRILAAHSAAVGGVHITQCHTLAHFHLRDCLASWRPLAAERVDLLGRSSLDSARYFARASSVRLLPCLARPYPAFPNTVLCRESRRSPARVSS